MYREYFYALWPTHIIHNVKKKTHSTKRIKHNRINHVTKVYRFTKQCPAYMIQTTHFNSIN